MKNVIKNFINQILTEDLHKIKSFELYKKKFLRENLKKNERIMPPKNTEIKTVYEEMIAKKEIKRNKTFESLLLTRKIRSLSGVAVVAVLTKPFECPGNCLFCSTEKDMPKSYLSNEPAAARAKSLGFRPYKQTQVRLKVLALNGHPTDKIELIVIGGTFSHFPKKYQTWFTKECFRAANDFPKNKMGAKNKSDLEKEKKRNEKAKNRIVGLTLETRPDFIDEKEIKNFRRLGATRVEIGIQSIYDDVLKKNNRGHLVAETIQATKLLKDAGFKINYHLMPGMLGSSPKRDLAMMKTIFSDSRFQPDMVKIYPCVVTENSELFKLWKTGKYKPLSNTQNKNLLVKIKKIIPPYVRITRLVRDIPEGSIVAGPNVSNLRQILKREKVSCNCIRCREIGSDFTGQEKIALNRIDYDASDGKEIFLEYVSTNKKKLFALLRLRIPENLNQNNFQKVLRDAAIIREVHTYGKLAGINKKEKFSPQHIGLGKKLIKEAEKIAKKEFSAQKIAVISGVGVRNYYRKFGYRLQDEYMIKYLKWFKKHKI